ncbi:Ubiquitin carboxyl-terminal hydrolase 12 [Hordeum vulgare]|nr:Ubiquitin carboxyl-terminal hydrolase 12 [Hordeum vulgare]
MYLRFASAANREEAMDCQPFNHEDACIELHREEEVGRINVQVSTCALLATTGFPSEYHNPVGISAAFAPFAKVLEIDPLSLAGQELAMCAFEEDRALEIECAYEEDIALELTAIVKHVKNPSPTSGCHNEVEDKQIQDWFPEADEFCFAGDLGISDEEEEDEVELPYLLKKPKSNKKKMKDRVLLKAIHEVFPHSPQRYCLRHIYANFQSTGFRAAELKKLVDQASYSFTKRGHELAMAELKAECEDACKWLEKIPKETWCRLWESSGTKSSDEKELTPGEYRNFQGFL